MADQPDRGRPGDRADVATGRGLRLLPVAVETARAVLAGDLSCVRAAAGWPHAGTADVLRSVVEDGAESWLVALRSGEVIGDLGWGHGPNADGAAEIGYALAPRWRGQGYGGAAVAGFVGWCRAQPGVRRLEADVLAVNLPSRRLLERLGFGVALTTGAYVRYARDFTSPV